MAREKALKELGKFVQNCKCGLMLAKKDFKAGKAECPRCGQVNDAVDAVKKPAEAIEANG